jgi:hypothetical protein
VIAAVVALAADRLARAGAGAGAVRPTAEDLARFVVPVTADPVATRPRVSVGADPFESAADVAAAIDSANVASSVAPRTRPRLTAILTADNSRVAVIDDATVAVGDHLRDGSRVTAIHADRVWLVARDGQWRVLSLTPSRH